MKTKNKFSPLLMMAVATLALGACDDASKTEETAQGTETSVAAEVAPVILIVMDASAFATAEGSTTGAVFLKIMNPGTEADRLIGATTSVSSMVEIHATDVDAAGTMQMRKIDGIAIEGGQAVELKADGNHLMLMGLTAPLAAGSSFDIVLDFEKGADVTVPVSVIAPIAAAQAVDHSAHSSAPAGTDAMEAGETAVESTTEAVTEGAAEAVDATEGAVDAAKDAASEAVDTGAEAVEGAADAATDAAKEAVKEMAPDVVAPTPATPSMDAQPAQ